MRSITAIDVGSFLLNMKPFSEFKVWFKLKCDADKVEIHSNVDGEWKPGEVKGLDELNDVESEYWNIFKSRPEYYVNKNMKDYFQDISSQSEYEIKLMGCALTRCGRDFKRNPDNYLDSINKCIEWLRGTDFFRAPASSRYHDSYAGGLCDHHLNVCREIVDLADTNTFRDRVMVEDAVLVSLLHDWCKIGIYEMYQRNVKNEDTGRWEKQDAYKTSENPYMNLGHGVSSMYLAQKFFKLKYEEALAIRHHMGRWSCPESEFNELQYANQHYPLVHLLQFADQLSIVKYTD